MAKLAWTIDLSVGVAEMDDEHRQLIGMMDSLLRSVEEPDVSHDTVLNSFKKLISFTEQRFHDEEALMGAQGYSDLPAHKMIHADLMKRLTAEFNHCLTGVGWLAAGCMKFFDFWLRTHIKSVDKKYGKVLSKHPH